MKVSTTKDEFVYYLVDAYEDTLGGSTRYLWLDKGKLIITNNEECSGIFIKELDPNELGIQEGDIFYSTFAEQSVFSAQGLEKYYNLFENTVFTYTYEEVIHEIEFAENIPSD